MTSTIPDASKAACRQLAAEIARGLGARVLPNHKHVFDEPHAFFRIPIHADPFWMTVKVATESFIFEAQHRRGDGAPVSFGIALVHEYRCMVASKPSPKLSRMAGVDVFTSDHFGEMDMELYASLMLETASLADLIRRLPPERIVHCFLNDSQLTAVVRMIAPEQAVADVALLRDVMLETYRISRHYHPDL
jgi:hypothetical protein